MNGSAPQTGLFAPSLGEQMRIAQAERRLRKGGVVLRLLIFLAGIGLAAFLAGFVLFVTLLDHSEPEPLNRADAIVVLTGGSDRIADAVQLLAEGRASRLLISGVNKDISPESIAKMLPQYADLFACCIDLDYGAGNTVGNATETRRWAREKQVSSIILVTSNYHMPRAMIEFRRAMPGLAFTARPVVPYAFDASLWWRDASTARVLFSEYTKFLAAWARSVASR